MSSLVWIIGIVGSALLVVGVVLRRRARAVTVPVCGSCGYAVEGLETFECPECGGDLRRVGIRTPGGAGRSPVVLVIAGWLGVVLALALAVDRFVIPAPFAPRTRQVVVLRAPGVTWLDRAEIELQYMNFGPGIVYLDGAVRATVAGKKLQPLRFDANRVNGDGGATVDGVRRWLVAGGAPTADVGLDQAAGALLGAMGATVQRKAEQVPLPLTFGTSDEYSVRPVTALFRTILWLGAIVVVCAGALLAVRLGRAAPSETTPA